jgi:hypothetical protein
MSRAAFVVMALAGVARADDATPTSLEELLSHTDEVAAHVAKVRGLRLKHKIPNEVVDRAELRKRLIAEAAEDKTAAETVAEGLALQRWGLVPLDYDYGARLLDLLSDQIAGYYDPKTKKLTVLDTAGDDPSWASMVLSHELDHGLQDQTFDLETFEKLPDDESDAALARHALVEGDGVALMLEIALVAEGVKNPWADPAVAGAVVASMNQPNAPAVGAKPDLMAEAPLALREAMLFPYRDGFAFVAALRRNKPWSAIDAAFKRPPRSTEQIMHVEKYLSDDKPIPVTAGTAPTGYTIFDTEVWGELGIRSFLRTYGVSDEVSSRAAAGWGGDRAVVLAQPGETNPRRMIGVARFEWDSEIDAREAENALEHAVDAMTVGALSSQNAERTQWMGLDGRINLVERKGATVMLIIGAPATVSIDAWSILLRK